MPRRSTRNKTGISRLPNVPYHDAWVLYVCLQCRSANWLRIGLELLRPRDALELGEWKCEHCGFIHSETTDLPFEGWPRSAKIADSLPAQRFWRAFFQSATEDAESHWKQCNTCGRVLPFEAFARHKDWGPLERQMECRACKAAINAVLNPKRTRQQLHEASSKRRVAELMISGDVEHVDIDDLFQRFGSRCFKTRKKLRQDDRGAWAIDHILPSKYLYPLSPTNAALLSTEANNKKRDRWPSQYYTNNELYRLAKITGADIELLSSKKPIVNHAIDVNACVARVLAGREHSDLKKRVAELKTLLRSYRLVRKLTPENRRLLGL